MDFESISSAARTHDQMPPHRPCAYKLNTYTTSCRNKVPPLTLRRKPWAPFKNQLPLGPSHCEVHFSWHPVAGGKRVRVWPPKHRGNPEAPVAPCAARWPWEPARQRLQVRVLPGPGPPGHPRRLPYDWRGRRETSASQGARCILKGVVVWTGMPSGRPAACALADSNACRWFRSGELAFRGPARRGTRYASYKRWTKKLRKKSHSSVG